MEKGKGDSSKSMNQNAEVSSYIVCWVKVQPAWSYLISGGVAWGQVIKDVNDRMPWRSTSWLYFQCQNYLGSPNNAESVQRVPACPQLTPSDNILQKNHRTVIRTRVLPLYSASN